MDECSDDGLNDCEAHSDCVNEEGTYHCTCHNATPSMQIATNAQVRTMYIYRTGMRIPLQYIKVTFNS